MSALPGRLITGRGALPLLPCGVQRCFGKRNESTFRDAAAPGSPAHWRLTGNSTVCRTASRTSVEREIETRKHNHLPPDLISGPPNAAGVTSGLGKMPGRTPPSLSFHRRQPAAGRGPNHHPHPLPCHHHRHWPPPRSRACGGTLTSSGSVSPIGSWRHAVTGEKRRQDPRELRRRSWHRRQ